MSTKKLILSLLAAMFAVASVTHAEQPANIQTSTTADQKGVGLTIYNSGRALVTDHRQLKLPAGQFELKFEGVAQRIMPETVAIQSPGLSVLEQNYEYDLLSPKKLLDKYVGKEMTLVVSALKNDSSDEKRIAAVLLANNEQPIWRIGNSIVTGAFAQRYEFPSVPENLIARPTLVWLLQNEGAKSKSVEVSYLTTGIGWKADYVLTLASDEKTAALEGWITIDNNSGAAYNDAKLQLIAGDVNQVQDGATMRRKSMVMTTVGDAVAQPAFEEKSFFEYHLYTLQRSATIKENQQKQISLLEVDGASIEKVFRLRGREWYYRQRYGDDGQKIEVALRLVNKKENKMGMPLPKGTVRVYKRDTDNGTQFIGEDAIDHTPKDETLDLSIGNAFDIKAERKQSDFKIVNNCTYEMAYEIGLRNHKDEPVSVIVSEPIGGDWKILSSSVPFTKTAAFAAEFKVPVAKDSENKLDYRVRVRYCK